MIDDIGASVKLGSYWSYSGHDYRVKGYAKMSRRGKYPGEVYLVPASSQWGMPELLQRITMKRFLSMVAIGRIVDVTHHYRPA